MTYDQFQSCCTDQSLPDDASELERSLYEDSRGDWDTAHAIAQRIPSRLGSAVHAYLHRKEGDTGNANYWYGRASRSPFEGTLEQEWEELAREVTD
jgi:hypothetical protein